MPGLPLSLALFVELETSFLSWRFAPALIDPFLDGREAAVAVAETVLDKFEKGETVPVEGGGGAGETLAPN